MECCGNCKYHVTMAQDTFMCDNEESEGYGLETVWDDCCEEFEERGIDYEKSKILSWNWFCRSEP